jgi:hypothetical protein
MDVKALMQASSVEAFVQNVAESIELNNFRVVLMQLHKELLTEEASGSWNATAVALSVFYSG